MKEAAYELAVRVLFAEHLSTNYVKGFLAELEEDMDAVVTVEDAEKRIYKIDALQSRDHAYVLQTLLQEDLRGGLTILN